MRRLKASLCGTRVALSAREFTLTRNDSLKIIHLDTLKVNSVKPVLSCVRFAAPWPRPLLESRKQGFLLLRDLRPEEPEDSVGARRSSLDFVGRWASTPVATGAFNS